VLKSFPPLPRRVTASLFWPSRLLAGTRRVPLARFFLNSSAMGQGFTSRPGQRRFAPSAGPLIILIVAGSVNFFLDPTYLLLVCFIQKSSPEKAHNRFRMSHHQDVRPRQE
jgi:hypothetical protein